MSSTRWVTSRATPYLWPILHNENKLLRIHVEMGEGIDHRFKITSNALGSCGVTFYDDSTCHFAGILCTFDRFSWLITVYVHWSFVEMLNTILYNCSAPQGHRIDLCKKWKCDHDLLEKTCHFLTGSISIASWINLLAPLLAYTHKVHFAMSAISCVYQMYRVLMTSGKISITVTSWT